MSDVYQSNPMRQEKLFYFFKSGELVLKKVISVAEINKIWKNNSISGNIVKLF